MTTLTVNHRKNKLKAMAYRLLSYSIPIIAILGLYLLLNDTALADGMNDEQIIQKVDKAIGSGSVAQKVLGGAGFVGSGIMALMGQIKMALITIFSVAVLFVIYNAKIIF